MNTDSNDTSQTNRIYDSATVSGRNATTTVRFAPDTIRTTTEQGILTSSTPAVCFYPSTSTKVKKKDSNGGNNESQNLFASSGILPTPLAEKIHSKMHRSLPSFNSMASTLLKDTWMGGNEETTNSLSSAMLGYPLQSDVSPITPTAQIGSGQQELLTFPLSHDNFVATYTTNATSAITQIPTSNTAVSITSIEPSGMKRSGNYSMPMNTDHSIPVTQSVDQKNIVGLNTTHINSTLSVVLPIGKETANQLPSSIRTSMIDPIPLNTNNKTHIHLQWLQQINSNIQPSPSSSLSSINNYSTTGSHTSAPSIQTPIEFTPSGSFLQALCNAQRELASGIDTSKIESEEKRARRLERNRESARQSRRRKKERLVKLSTRVQKLQGDIDSERRKKIECMEKDLRLEKLNKIQELVSLLPLNVTSEEDLRTRSDCTTTKTTSISQDDYKPELQVSLDDINVLAETETQQQQQQQQEMITSTLHTIIQTLGPNSNSRRAVATFQYQLLRHLILDEYQKIILWLLFKGESFFTFAREKHSKVCFAFHCFRIVSFIIIDCENTTHESLFLRSFLYLDFQMFRSNRFKTNWRSFSNGTKENIKYRK